MIVDITEGVTIFQIRATVVKAKESGTNVLYEFEINGESIPENEFFEQAMKAGIYKYI